MTCTRCHGFILREVLPGYGRWWWRCVACGDRVDGVILRNRAEMIVMAQCRREAQQRDLSEWSRLFPSHAPA